MTNRRDVKPERARRPKVQRKPDGRFHHPDLREALVRAGIAGVEEHGHVAVSLSQLAARAGVTQPAIYRHFANKEALLAEVAARGLADLDAAMKTAIEAHLDDPFAAVEATCQVYVRFAHANPGWFRLYFTRHHIEVVRPPGPPPTSASRPALLDVIARLLPPNDPLVFDLFRVVWALSHGLAVFVVERTFQLVQTDAERIAAADAAIRIQIDLLRARGRVRP